MKFKIEESAVETIAETRFFQMCSFDLGDAGQRKMEDLAFSVREHLRQQMEMQVAVRFFDEVSLQKDELQLGDESLRCSAFSHVPPEAVKGAFVYLLTIGETDTEGEEGIMAELYHDIWGTAYVESALGILRKDLLPSLLDGCEGYLSESFGPGYYGMAMEEGTKLFSLLDGASVGVMQKKSGLLHPEKSCLGVILIYDRDGIRIGAGCAKCLGNRGGCRFCEKGLIKEQK